jgi:hypothetical protein
VHGGLSKVVIRLAREEKLRKVIAMTFRQISGVRPVEADNIPPVERDPPVIGILERTNDLDLGNHEALLCGESCETLVNKG